MIEINLMPVKRTFSLPVIMGIDLKLLNFKLILVALLLHSFSLPLINGNWEEEILTEQNKISELQKKFQEVESQGAASREIQEKVDVLNAQEKKLQEKLNVVRQIIKIKKNPLNIMIYFSKNIPSDIWLNTFILDNDKITIEGGSTSYKSIGLFMENLQEAIFFGNTLKLEDSRTETDEESGRRSEMFKIGATVMRYE